MSTRKVRHANAVIDGGFTMIPNMVLLDGTLTLAARMLYGALLSFAWYDKEVFPGQSKLAEMLGCKERAVRNYLQELEERGLVSHERVMFDGGSRCVYTLHDPTGTPVPLGAPNRHAGAGSNRHVRAGEVYEVKEDKNLRSRAGKTTGDGHFDYLFPPEPSEAERAQIASAIVNGKIILGLAASR